MDRKNGGAKNSQQKRVAVCHVQESTGSIIYGRSGVSAFQKTEIRLFAEKGVRENRTGLAGEKVFLELRRIDFRLNGGVAKSLKRDLLNQGHGGMREGICAGYALNVTQKVGTKTS